MSNLQEIVDRLEHLLYKEHATPLVMRGIERQFEEAEMIGWGSMRTEQDPMEFCSDLYSALSQLTPWAIGQLHKPLAFYETAQDLVDAMIAGNDHLD